VPVPVWVNFAHDPHRLPDSQELTSVGCFYAREAEAYFCLLEGDPSAGPSDDVFRVIPIDFAAVGIYTFVRQPFPWRWVSVEPPRLDARVHGVEWGLHRQCGWFLYVRAQVFPGFGYLWRSDRGVLIPSGPAL
jgi:hypothetical protein